MSHLIAAVVDAASPTQQGFNVGLKVPFLQGLDPFQQPCLSVSYYVCTHSLWMALGLATD